MNSQVVHYRVAESRNYFKAENLFTEYAGGDFSEQ